MLDTVMRVIETVHIMISNIVGSTPQWCGEAVACHGNQTFYNSFIARDKVYKLGDVVYVRHVDDFERVSWSYKAL